MNEAEAFFYDNAPYSWKPAIETEEQGKARCASELAAAERRLKDGPYFVAHEPDPDPYDGDVPYDGPLWVVTLWSVSGTDEPELVGSLGSVACEEGDPYMRVVAAELALEYIPTGDNEGSHLP